MSSSSSANSKVILIVEDERDIRNAIQEILELEGFRVLSAADGREGIAILTQAQPSLVLLDLNMPVMDGWEFLHKIRTEEKTARVPVVVLSACGSAQRPAGADAFLRKPLGLNDLIQVADNFCRQQELQAG